MDKHIIYELVDNCRIPYQELAEKTGITANAVRKRINKLERSGVIDYYTLELTYNMIGAHSMMAWVATDGSLDEEEFSDIVGNNELVLDVTPHSGGHYAVFADYISAEDMSNLARFIRNQESVLNIEIHPRILYTKDPPKSEFELKKLHFRVLEQLLENPRMQVSDIALEANLSSRRVRRALKEIADHGGIRFTLKWNPEVSKGTHFSARIRYDEAKVSYQECRDWLNEKYPIRFWEVFESTIEPLTLAYFVVSTMEEVELITREIRQADFVDSVISYVATKTRSYKGLRSKFLIDMIKEAGV